MASMSYLGGGPEFSADLTIVMYRIVVFPSGFRVSEPGPILAEE